MDVLGNGDIQDILLHAVDADRLHHALLFHGPEGVGKRRMAFRLAMYRTCPQRSDSSVDCGGSCPSCTRMLKHYEALCEEDHEQGTLHQFHPDLIYLEPPAKESGVIIIGDKKKKPENYPGSIKWLNERLHLKPIEAIGQTVVIDRPERIQHDARHSMLKILEEPPPACLIILVTSQPGALLSTYRSRCQSVRFRRFSRTGLEEILRDRFDIPPEEARQLSGISRGSLGRALELDLETWREQRALALEMVQTAARPGWGARQSLMEMAAAISGSAKQWELVGREIPELLGSLLRDLVLLQSGSPQDLLDNRDLAGELGGLAGQLNRLDPGRAYQLTTDVKKGLERNHNRRLVCEMMLINLSGICGTDLHPA